MVVALTEPAATVVLTAAFTGFRRGELRGMLWQNLEPATATSLATYCVSRSIWNGIATDPKTSKSKAPVPIIGLELNNLYRRTLSQFSVRRHRVARMARIQERPGNESASPWSR